MVIWRITGNEIGPDGNGASHYATREEAEKRLQSYRKEGGKYATGPIKLIVKNREQLAQLLDDAMGYGAS
jgi:hypothetical protein